ncbi:hypothetical protein L484_027768 [Morus notabilis]|uniref:Uncharacterized protein n=1 Tax=Morus notabilis TaxID=981085 RepID=W9RKT4_9ROSA|nr:hypothetical protein L484_027768 [Morus notabilis]
MDADMGPREENYNSDVQVEVSDSENSDSENDDQVSVIVDNEELIGMNATSAADEDEIQSPYNFEDFAREGMKKIEETERLFKDARIDSFRVFCEAMARKRGGESNQRRGWYPSSRDEICPIVSRGFSRCDDPRNDDSYGVGIYLNPNFSLDSAISSVEDESGLRHAKETAQNALDELSYSNFHSVDASEPDKNGTGGQKLQ